MNAPIPFRPRIIPVLLLHHGLLYKTTAFGEPKYVGEPRNAVRIFNEKGADELVLLDIGVTPEGTSPDLENLAEIASEAFMPLAYGGGITTTEQAQRILGVGFEKVILGTRAVEDPALVTEFARQCGSQSVVACIDIRKDILGRTRVVTHSGRVKTKWDPAELAKRLAADGVGEIIIQSVNRDGRMQGYDLETTRRVVDAVDVPVVALGGAGTEAHLAEVITQGGASAAAAGSLFVFQGPHRAVLITYPDDTRLNNLFHTGTKA